MGWPQQQMGWSEWTELAAEAGGWFDEEAPADGSPHGAAVYKRMYPGQIVAERREGKLILNRLSRSE
jgi:hypothetical protein